MSSYLTLEDALKELRQNPQDYLTRDALINLVGKIDATNSFGGVTVLYSGQPIYGVSSYEIVASMARNGETIRIVDNTDAAKFLVSEPFRDAWAAVHGLTREDLLMPVSSLTPAKQAAINAMNASLYHPTDGPWADVSARFVDATEGEIRTLTGGAVPDRVFGQTEIPHAINNEKITFIDGIPREDLQSRGAADAFKAISLQSDIYAAELKFAVDSDGNLIKAPTYGADGARLGDLPRLDSSDFFAATGIPSKDPPIVFEHYRNGANFPPRLSHNQLEFHREGAEIIHEIKTHYIEQSRLTGIDHAALRAAAVRVLDKLGWAGDLVALGLVAGEANAAIDQGDNERAATVLGRWMAEFGGGLATGLAAAKLVGSALAPLYLMGPAGAVAAGSLTLLAGLAGGLLGEAAAGAAFDAVKAELQKLFGQANVSSDPLVLDLDGNGVTTLALSDSIVYFDLDHNGFAERTGWVSPNDGLLVLDRNGNGKIDSGAELFGNHTLARGAKASDGLQALAAFDLNGDRIINASDQVFHQLRIWKDINSNGRTDDGELLSLNDAKVASLDLSASWSGYLDRAGNEHRLVSRFETTEGQWLAMADVWFNTAPQDSRALREYATTAAIDRLPDLPSMGNTLSLHQAMAADTTGLLQSLVERWISVPADRQPLIHEIVQTWVGVSGVDPLSRGPFNPDDLIVRRDYHSLVLSWGKEDSVRLFNMWNQPDVVAKVTFANGQVITAEELFQRAQAHGSERADYIDGADDRVNRMWGHGGDDRLSGGSLNDSFTGGSGNDWLIGGEGSDVYHFGRGDGWDWISEVDRQSDDVDVLMLGEGIRATDLRFEREGPHLHIHFAGGEERVTVASWFDTFIKGSRLEEIRFSEGDIEVLRDEDIEAILEGKSLPLPQSPSSEASTLKSLVLSAALVNVPTPLTPLDSPILAV